MYMCACHNTRVEDSRQFIVVSFLLPIWVLGIEFRSSGLVASAFSLSAGTDLSYFKIRPSHLPSLEL